QRQVRAAEVEAWAQGCATEPCDRLGVAQGTQGDRVARGRIPRVLRARWQAAARSKPEHPRPEADRRGSQRAVVRLAHLPPYLRVVAFRGGPQPGTGVEMARPPFAGIHPRYLRAPAR